MEYSFTCPDAASTAERGAALAGILKKGDVVLFFGDLGAGKTTFIRGLIRRLAGDDTDVVSPTFTLVQTYETPKGVVYHYDLYRLGDDDTGAVVELGWDDGVVDGITLVEWSERLPPDFVPDALEVLIDADDKGLRHIQFGGTEAWLKRLEQHI